MAATAILAAIVTIAIAAKSQTNHRSPPSANAAATVSADETVLLVDGQGVPARELRIFLLRERSAILSGAQGSGPPASSSKSQASSTDAQIFSAAVRDAAWTVVQFQLAARHGLVKEPTYSAFLSTWTSQNAARARAVDAHKPIYGPTQYSEANYLDYEVGNIRYALTSVYTTDGTFDMSANALQRFAQDHAVDLPSPADSDWDQAVQAAYADFEYQNIVEARVDGAHIVLTTVGRAMRVSSCASIGNC